MKQIQEKIFTGNNQSTLLILNNDDGVTAESSERESRFGIFNWLYCLNKFTREKCTGISSFLLIYFIEIQATFNC